MTALRTHAAFTLMEMLIVLVIIGILAGLLIPIGGVIMSRRDHNRASALAIAIATAIASYPAQRWELSGTVRRTYPWLWDMNVPGSGGRPVGDGLIDGFPAASADASHDGPFEAPLLASGYAGFARMLMPELLADPKALNAIGQPLDPWGSPMRIEFSSAGSGPSGCRVWSIGKDKVDAQGQGDDVSSESRR